MLDIRNKWALVTGASRGVGLQVACALASRGCNLVVHSRKKEHTAPEAQQLSKNVKVIQLRQNSVILKQ